MNDKEIPAGQPVFKNDGELLDSITFNVKVGNAESQNTQKDGVVVTTTKNPYVMVWRETKYEAVAVAFQRYLERLAEIEGVQIPSVQSNETPKQN